MASRPVILGIGAIALSTAVVAAWSVEYPSGDSKSLEYIAWKSGLYQMNVDYALEVMVHDPGRDSLVLGKTKPELKSKFGYLLPLSKARADYQSCYAQGPWKDEKDVMFIRDSFWMVRFEAGKAAEIVAMKAC